MDLALMVAGAITWLIGSQREKAKKGPAVRYAGIGVFIAGCAWFALAFLAGFIQGISKHLG